MGQMKPVNIQILGSDGSILLFIMVMIAFIGALAWSFTGTAKLYIDDIYSVKKYRGRSFSLSQMQKMLSTTKSLSESSRFVPLNMPLHVCLEGGPNGVCIENCCQGGISQGFYFKDPLDTTAQIEAKRNLSGPPGNPIYYKLDGNFCLTALQGNFSPCAYALTSTFTAQCPGGLATCDHAEHLRVSLFLTPLPEFPQIKERELVSYYFPKVNYAPVVPAIGDQSLTLGMPLTISMTADPGHPSEVQNFKFEQCLSADESIVKIDCQAYPGGVGQIVLQPQAIGTTTLTIQINDGELTNYLSKPYTFNTVVLP